MENSGSNLSDTATRWAKVKMLFQSPTLKSNFIVHFLLIGIVFIILYCIYIRLTKRFVNVYIMGPRNSGKTCLFYKVIYGLFPRTVSSQCTNNYSFNSKLKNLPGEPNDYPKTFKDCKLNRTEIVRFLDIVNFNEFEEDLTNHVSYNEYSFGDRCKFIFIFDSTNRKSYKGLCNLLLKFFIINILRKPKQFLMFRKHMNYVKSNTTNLSKNDSNSCNMDGSLFNRKTSGSNLSKNDINTNCNIRKIPSDRNKILLIGNKNDMFNSKNLSEMNTIILLELELLINSYVNINSVDNFLNDLSINNKNYSKYYKNMTELNQSLNNYLITLKEQIFVSKDLNGLGGFEIELISCSVKNDDLRYIREFIYK